MDAELEQAITRLRLAVFDFDGVFTDNRVWVNEHGEEWLACCRADSLGLQRLDEVGVGTLVITAERVPVATARARKLEIECVQGADDKLAALREAAASRGVPLDETAYVGNDANDAACLEAVGLPVVPADAWSEVVPFARWVLQRRGGEGCVREFCDAVWHVRRAA